MSWKIKHAVHDAEGLWPSRWMMRMYVRLWDPAGSCMGGRTVQKNMIGKGNGLPKGAYGL